MQFFLKIIDRLFMIAGAFLFLQAPQFINAYSQQMEGHVTELHLQIDAIKKAAAQSGKTLEQYISKFVMNSDSDFNLQGRFMQGVIERFSQLSQGLSSLKSAKVWERPFVFVRYLNLEIAQATLNSYAIGLPLTWEGGVYACIGALLGFLLFYVLKKGSCLIYAGIAGLFRSKKKETIDHQSEN